MDRDTDRRTHGGMCGRKVEEGGKKKEIYNKTDT